MRDILVTVIVFGSLPLILRRPSVGIVMWCWISYMNPHRLSWGFAYSLPFAQIIAVCTLVGMVLAAESKQIPRANILTVLWFSFVSWTGITTIFAIYPDLALTEFIEKFKVQFMTLVTVIVMCDRRRIHLLLWVIVISIGFYGVKGGIFTLTTGGAHRVWGPPNSDIADNNSLALALFMLLPLAFLLHSWSGNRWIRHGLLLAMLLMTVAAVGSYSRGGLLAGLCMAGFLWLKSHHKIATGGIMAVTLPLLFMFMPQSWHVRMDTIVNYEQDASAMNRFEAWTMSYNAANDLPFGGGFRMASAETYRRYLPTASGGTRGAHSIYFSVLGEHGWVGLILFILTLVAAWRTGSWIIRRTEEIEELRWAADLARMVQVSLVAFATGGAFQSLAYYDFAWHLVAILVSLRLIVERELAQASVPQSPESRKPQLRIAPMNAIGPL